MRAAYITTQRSVSDGPLTIGDLPLPHPGPGQALLRVRACGICRTDLHIVEGELPPLYLTRTTPQAGCALSHPLIPGHQIVGEVVEGATAEFPVGSRVGVSWVGGIDGTCEYCRLGL